MTPSNAAAPVVVVNDDASQLRLITRLLEKDGLTVRAFARAEDALASLQEDPRAGAVLTDLHLPGMSGAEFCQALRAGPCEALRAAPIIVMSADFADEDAQEAAKRYGADAALPAPVKPGALREAVRQAMASKPRP